MYGVLPISQRDHEIGSVGRITTNLKRSPVSHNDITIQHPHRLAQMIFFNLLFVLTY